MSPMFGFLKKQKVRSLLSLIILLAIIVTIVVIYKKKVERFIGMSPSPALSSDSDLAVVTYYYLPGCPYCVAFKDEWAKFQGMADPSLMTAVSIDGNDSNNKEKISSEGISGYPTIRITKNGNTIDYKGKREASALIDYVSKL